MPKIPKVVWVITIITVCILVVGGAAVAPSLFKRQTPTPGSRTGSTQSSAATGSMLPVISAPSSLQPGSLAGDSNINPQASATAPIPGTNAASLQSAPAPSGTDNVDPTKSNNRL